MRTTKVAAEPDIKLLRAKSLAATLVLGLSGTQPHDVAWSQPRLPIPLAFPARLAGCNVLGALPAQADCDSDLKRVNAMIERYNALPPRASCAAPDVVREIISSLEAIIPAARTFEQCPRAIIRTPVSKFERDLVEWRDYSKRCTDQQAQSRQQRSDEMRSAVAQRGARTPSSIFDCSRKPAAGGASWDAECLETRQSGAAQHRSIETAQELSRRANEQCRNLAGENLRRCTESAKIRILMTEIPAIRRACGRVDAARLVACVDAAYANDADLETIRDNVRKSLRDASERSGSADDGARNPAQAAPARQPPSAATAPRPEDDNVYCLFVAHRIREGDLAYSRAEQVPPECRKMPEIRAALEAAARVHPVFPISGPRTDCVIAQLIKGLDGGAQSANVSDQLPPAEKQCATQ